MCTGTIAVLAYVTLITSVALATPPSLPDVPATHPYYQSIAGLAERGIIGGYTNGNFGPSDDVMRQQFAKMVVRTGGYPVLETDACPSGDVAISGPDGLCPDNYVAVCAAKGISVGKTATAFDPYANITRYQVITMVVRAADDAALGMLGTAPGSYGTWGMDPTHGPHAARA